MNRTEEYLQKIRELNGLKNAILYGITVSKRDKQAEFSLVTDRTYTAREEAEALHAGDVERFLSLVRESGDSSEALLQNLYSTSAPTEQAIPLGVMVSKRVLNGKGAVRVHGGGFAGTIQAFVPLEVAEEYVKEMERVFGEGTCYVFRIRPVGGTEITV